MPKPRGRCLHCGARLAIYLWLKDGEFCSANHRRAFREEQQRLALVRLGETGQMLSQALGTTPQALLEPEADEGSLEEAEVPLSLPDDPPLAAALNPRHTGAIGGGPVASSANLAPEVHAPQAVCPVCPPLSTGHRLQAGGLRNVFPAPLLSKSRRVPVAYHAWAGLPSLPDRMPVAAGRALESALHLTPGHRHPHPAAPLLPKGSGAAVTLRIAPRVMAIPSEPWPRSVAPEMRLTGERIPITLARPVVFGDGNRRGVRPPVPEVLRIPILIRLKLSIPSPRCTSWAFLLELKLPASKAKASGELQRGAWLRVGMRLSLDGLNHHGLTPLPNTICEPAPDIVYPHADTLFAPDLWRRSFAPGDHPKVAVHVTPSGAATPQVTPELPISPGTHSLPQFGLLAPTRLTGISPRSRLSSPVQLLVVPTKVITLPLRFGVPRLSPRHPSLRELLLLRGRMQPIHPVQRQPVSGVPLFSSRPAAVLTRETTFRASAFQHSVLVRCGLVLLKAAPLPRANDPLPWTPSPCLGPGKLNVNRNTAGPRTPDYEKLFALRVIIDPNQPAERQQVGSRVVSTALRPMIGSFDRELATEPFYDLRFRPNFPGLASRILERIGRRHLLFGLIPVLISAGCMPMFWGSAADKSSKPGPLGAEWSTVQQSLATRAGVKLAEDFRSGLDNWVGRGESAVGWTFDETGFVLPAKMGIFRPSLGLTDYSMDFLGQVDKKALSWVFRARDSRNYQAVKLMITRPGPLPTLVLRRYTVLEGREMSQKDTILPITVRGDTLLEVNLEAQGDYFSIRVQGRLVDSWTDKRLATGGIGFFSSKGESSRIRWVHFRHQYDVLGRICAFLSWPSLAGNSTRSIGSWE